MIVGFDGSRAFINNRTGTENYSYQLLKALTKIDRKNSYIVYVRNLLTTNYKLPTNFLIKKISWPRLWTQGGLALQTFRDNLDMLFVPAHTLPLLRKSGLKTVVTVHDLGSEYLPSMHQIKQRLYLSLMQKYQLRTASKIIAVSKATKQDLINKIGIPQNKIAVIYEGYDKEIYNLQFTIYKNETDIQRDVLKSFNLVPRFYFLFVGTVQPRKNLERVIKAYSLQLTANRQKTKKSVDCSLSTVNYNLVIAGSKGWLANDIYRLPKALGIEKRVKFLGYVPDKDLPKLYSGAIALVFPSLFEGFGLPILEAQACGCPVITSNISSMPEVAGKGAVLVDPYDVEAITHAMIRVQATGVRQQLVNKGFENIKRFSWEKCAKETLEVLEEVVKS